MERSTYLRRGQVRFENVYEKYQYTNFPSGQKTRRKANAKARQKRERQKINYENILKNSLTSARPRVVVVVKIINKKVFLARARWL